jgi:hypothetical protein
MISKRTQIRVLVDGTPSGNGWSAKTLPNENEEDQKKNRLSLQVDSPSDAIIGKYTVNFFIQKNIFFLLSFLFIVIT